jgi:hypothetical protein
VPARSVHAHLCRIQTAILILRGRRLIDKRRNGMAQDQSRWASLAADLAFGLALMGQIAPVASFTDKEAREIFATLGPDSNGHVSRVQFEQTKLNAFYFRHRPTSDYEMKPLTFEETGLSREFLRRGGYGP